MSQQMRNSLCSRAWQVWFLLYCPETNPNGLLMWFCRGTWTQLASQSFQERKLTEAKKTARQHILMFVKWWKKHFCLTKKIPSPLTPLFSMGILLSFRELISMPWYVCHPWSLWWQPIHDCWLHHADHPLLLQKGKQFQLDVNKSDSTVAVLKIRALIVTTVSSYQSKLLRNIAAIPKIAFRNKIHNYHGMRAFPALHCPSLREKRGKMAQL